MQLLYKFIVYSLFAFCIGFVIYSYRTFQKFKKNPQIKMPAQFRALSEVIDNFSFLSILRDTIAKSAILVYGDTQLGNMYGTTIVLTWLPLSTVIFMVSRTVTTVWYFSLINIIICIILPIIFFISKISAKADEVRAKMISCYEVVTASIMDEGKIQPIVVRIINTTTGTPRKLFNKFLSDYSKDSVEAYNNLASSVGDEFSRAFCDNMMEFEDCRTDISVILSKNNSMAEIYYKLKLKSRKIYRIYKVLVLIYIFIIAAINKSSALLVGLVGNIDSTQFTDTNSIFYLTILIPLIYFVMCFIYENN